jgi:hypothetical protein
MYDLGLTEQENKFIKMVSDYTGDDTSLLVTEIYELAKQNGFSRHETSRIIAMLKGLHFVETGIPPMDSYKGDPSKGDSPIMYPGVRLTSEGVLYVRNLVNF